MRLTTCWTKIKRICLLFFSSSTCISVTMLLYCEFYELVWHTYNGNKLLWTRYAKYKFMKCIGSYFIAFNLNESNAKIYSYKTYICGHTNTHAHAHIQWQLFTLAFNIQFIFIIIIFVDFHLPIFCCDFFFLLYDKEKKIELFSLILPVDLWYWSCFICFAYMLMRKDEHSQ